MPTTTSFFILLFLLSFIIRPLSSTLHHRRILHQPFLPIDSSPPPTTSSPSPPKYPFTTPTPDNLPFFPSSPSPPAPPSPASFASFPVNISSLSVPRPSKPNSTSSKLIPAAVSAVVAALAVVSLAVFLHLRKRNGSSSSNEIKSQRSDDGSTVSFNQTPVNHHIPKLQRPSENSSEFLYLGTLVNSHTPGGGASTANYSIASNARKFDSPELHPLPPLNKQQQNSGANAEVVSSKDDESEEFYSPKGFINGKQRSIDTGPASRKAFAATEVENLHGSTSNSTSPYSSYVPGSGSGSPARSVSLSLFPAHNTSLINSMPKSPDLIEILSTVPQMMPPPETRGLLLQESASPSPPSSSSPGRYSRSEESSPRNSNASEQNVESLVTSNSAIQHKTNFIPTSPEIRDLVLPEAASPLPPISLSSERFSNKSEESSPRNTNTSDQNVESPVRSNRPIQHDTTVIPTPQDIQSLVLPESVPPLSPSSSSPERYLRRSEEPSPSNSNVSEQNVECPVRISSPAEHKSTAIPASPEMQHLMFPESAFSLPPSSFSPERFLRRSDESSPRISNASDQNVESPVRICCPAQPNSTDVPTSPEMQNLVFPESAIPDALSPDRDSGKNEKPSPRISNASEQDVEPLASSPVQHNTIVIPTPPEMQDLVLSSREKYLGRNEESLPRISNASDQDVVSPVRISSPEQHEPPSPNSSSFQERYSRRSEGSSSKILNDSDRDMESPLKNGSHVQLNAAVIPTPPPPPPPPTYLPVLSLSVPSPAPPVSVLAPPPVPVPPPPPPPPPPLSKIWHSPKTPTSPSKPSKMPIQSPASKNPIAFGSPSLISPMQLPSNDPQTVKNEEDKEYSDKEAEDSSKTVEWHGESHPKPKLKSLHWDKVRSNSDREMVWDQLKCSSFKLNEEMIETLFVVNTPKPNPTETTRWQGLPSPSQDNGNRVLDPNKAQNIAILLKALHVTVDEVCEGLLEGNADFLGTELLESLLKMAPTKEEERKLKEYEDDSSVRLGHAERFLKAVVDIPHAFRRAEALLYISNFESEVEYLKKSFGTLETACEELRTSKMLLKLLEAVLKTGNRMNVGTNRGDAHAFKLDTLLKLVDVKGADGKTTLLHFVVQEIITSEGARLSGRNSQENSSVNDDAKCRKLGLQVVSALSSELSNVKKAAVMDAEMLSSDVCKLSKGIGNIREIVKLNEETSSEETCRSHFSDYMNTFIEMAEEEIFRIQAQESLALSLVKEITEYFHGDSAKEEAYPFRIFMVVRDFLSILDRVCKEVGMINERTIVSSAHKFPVPVNPMLQQVSAVFHKRQDTSSDDESLPSNV